jgi:hypothetical protein
VNRTFLAVCMAGVLVLTVLYWLYRPGEGPAGALSPDDAAGDTVIPVNGAGLEHPEPAAIAIELRQGRRVSGPDIIRVRQGETLHLRLLSDHDAELHLHGYDLHLHLRAGEPREWIILAEHGGRFEYEMHGSHHGAHEALGVIEVLPR